MKIAKEPMELVELVTLLVNVQPEVLYFFKAIVMNIASIEILF